VGGFGEDGVDVGAGVAPAKANVVAPLLVDGGSVGLQGCLGVDDDGQGIVIDEDEVGGVGGNVTILGNDDGDGIAHVADTAAGQRVAFRSSAHRIFL